MIKWWKSLFFSQRFFLLMGISVLTFVLGFIFPGLLFFAKLAFAILILLVLVDFIILYRWKEGLTAERNCADRFSNGDDNEVTLTLTNRYQIPLKLRLIDDLPDQFQIRDQTHDVNLPSGSTKSIVYTLRPVKRGSYSFGNINALVRSSNLGLVMRRYVLGEPQDIKVYPSFLQMRKYELLALAPNRSEYGMKKIRRLGHNLEFEHIKNYVPGDDYRAINWKATARKNALMVNNYQDEKSQQVYSIIDKGRSMKMPFEGMSLMDYAINATLVISNIALQKDDKAGIISFQHKLGNMLPASKRRLQMKLILENLYNQKTNYKESNYYHLYAFVKRKITNRSLLLLFTNFETLSGMRRQLRNLKSLAKNHVLVVIFFKNTELFQVLEAPAQKVTEVYSQTIARKFAYEKRLIAKELNQHGIYTILTTPKELTVNTINKYLELKARGII